MFPASIVTSNKDPILFKPNSDNDLNISKCEFPGALASLAGRNLEYWVVETVEVIKSRNTVPLEQRLIWSLNQKFTYKRWIIWEHVQEDHTNPNIPLD